MATLFWLKAIGTTLFIALFFYAYFAILAHTSQTALEMPLTWVDRWIPFTPAAFPVYVALWVYVSLPPALLTSLRTLTQFTGWMAALCTSALAIFYACPTRTPPANIDFSAYPEMTLLKGLDAAGNACPSLHVSTAVFAAFWLHRLFATLQAPVWLRRGNWFFCLAILWSTLATRQHVFLDVVAGTLMGAVFAVLSLHSLRIDLRINPVSR
jgi:membrane-associated phospholipid phosphatase